MVATLIADSRELSYIFSAVPKDQIFINLIPTKLLNGILVLALRSTEILSTNKCKDYSGDSKTKNIYGCAAHCFLPFKVCVTF